MIILIQVHEFLAIVGLIGVTAITWVVLVPKLLFGKPCLASFSLQEFLKLELQRLGYQAGAW